MGQRRKAPGGGRSSQYWEELAPNGQESAHQSEQTLQSKQHPLTSLADISVGLERRVVC